MELRNNDMKHRVPCFRQFSVAACLRGCVRDSAVSTHYSLTQFPSGRPVERVTLLSSVQYSMSHVWRIVWRGSSENSSLLIRDMSGLDLPHHILQYSISSVDTCSARFGVTTVSLSGYSALIPCSNRCDV
ncbi:hypothetical protein Pcinc_021927 [Petrolisthes cinctipes]|uniref:Uncharacterized protein n=1 Tax=Petrolisthes cinctipes TaxID=88211 RepID=A0AAE1FF27_PETCI|nr:hypothetical protein Pcinc_021927 [Petrolisthes cinctipes]